MSKRQPKIEEMLKDGRLQRGNDPKFKLQRFSTGIPDLDGILNGGIPRGRITIMSGEYSSGKSLLIQFFMKKALDDGLSVAYVDTEMSYDPVWWQTIGLKLENLFIAQPKTGEEGVDMIMALIKGGVDIIALDSLAGLVPAVEQEAEEKQQFIGGQARLINSLFRKILTVEHRSAIVFTNQLRDNIGGGVYAPDKLPGGRGQQFFAHLMLRTRRDGWIDEKGEHVGYNIRIICQKSKVGTPFGECKLPFLFRGELDFLSLLVDRAIDGGLVKQAGPWYTITILKDAEAVLGRNTLINMLREDEALQTQLKGALGEVKV